MALQIEAKKRAEEGQSRKVSVTKDGVSRRDQ